jgi:hypothetical protein
MHTTPKLVATSPCVQTSTSIPSPIHHMPNKFSPLKRVAMIVTIVTAPILAAACSDSTAPFGESATTPDALFTSAFGDTTQDSIPTDSVPRDSISKDSVPQPVASFTLTAFVRALLDQDPTKIDTTLVVPVAKATVAVYRVVFLNGQPLGPGTLVASALSNQEGKVAFPNLPSGTYRIEATAIRTNIRIFEAKAIIPPPTVPNFIVTLLLAPRLLPR